MVKSYYSSKLKSSRSKLKSKAIELSKNMSYHKISEALQIPYPTIQRWLKTEKNKTQLSQIKNNGI